MTDVVELAARTLSPHMQVTPAHETQKTAPLFAIVTYEGDTSGYYDDDESDRTTYISVDIWSKTGHPFAASEIARMALRAAGFRLSGGAGEYAVVAGVLYYCVRLHAIYYEEV